MITPELVNYIQKQLKEGKPKEEIFSVLRGQGWSESDLAEASRGIDLSLAPSPPVLPSPSPVQPVNLSQPLASAEPVSDAELESVYQAAGVSLKPSFKKKTLLVVSLAAFLVLAAAGTAAYFLYFQSPEKIMEKVFEKADQIKSEKFSGQFNLEIIAAGLDDLFSALSATGPARSPLPGNLPISTKAIVGVAINFDGGSDISDKDHPKFFFNFNLINKDEPADDQKSSFGLEMKGIDKVIYLKAKETPWLPLGDLKDQWIKVDLEALKNQAEQMGVKIEEVQKGQLTPEQMQQITAEFKKAKILKIVAKLPSEKIDGQNTYHYRYKIEKEPLKKFILDFNDLVGGEKLKEAEIEEFNKAMNGLSEIEGEIWIGRKDFFARKGTIRFEIKVDEEEVKGSAKIDLVIFSKNINQPLSVEAPAQTKSLEEILGSLFKSIMQPTGDCEVKTGGEKDQCYFDLAKISRSGDPCGKITSLDKRNDCYYEIAKSTASYAQASACEDITGPKSQGWKDECYRAVAEIRLDSSLCQKIISSDWKNYCLAGATKDLTFCQAIKKASTKSACLVLFKNVP